MPDVLARSKARLVALCEAVNANRAEGEALFRERDELLRELRAEGVPSAELVALSKLTPRALKWILSDGAQARMAKKAAAKGAKKRTAKKRAKAKR